MAQVSRGVAAPKLCRLQNDIADDKEIKPSTFHGHCSLCVLLFPDSSATGDFKSGHALNDRTVQWPTLAAQWRCYRRLKAKEDQLDTRRADYTDDQHGIRLTVPLKSQVSRWVPLCRRAISSTRVALYSSVSQKSVNMEPMSMAEARAVTQMVVNKQRQLG